MGLCYLYCNCQVIGSSFFKAHVHPFRFAALYYCFEVTVVLMFLSFFRRQSTNQLKKCTGLCSSTQLKTTRKNSGAFEQKKSFFTRKSHLRQSCTKPFNCWTQCLICLRDNMCEEALFPLPLHFKRKHWAINVDIIRLESSSPWYFKQIPVVLFNAEIHFASLHAWWQTLRPNKPALIECHFCMEIHSFPVFPRLIDALSMFTDLIGDLLPSLYQIIISNTYFFVRF